MTEENEIIQGAIAAVVYQNVDNGYAVLRLNVGGGQNVTVVGTVPLPVVGEQLMVTGRWSSHSTYGRQFEAEFLERLMPQTSVEILNYLSDIVIQPLKNTAWNTPHILPIPVRPAHPDHYKIALTMSSYPWVVYYSAISKRYTLT